VSRTIPRRCVVTGHDPEGRSTVSFDGPTDDLAGDPADPILINFWTTGQEIGRRPIRPTPLGPPPGGATFRFFRIHPEKDSAHLAPAEREARIASYYRSVGVEEAHMAGARHPGFHKTLSVDFIVLLEGAVTLMLDTVDIPLKRFDVVVQRATSHAWVNYADSPALMMAVLTDTCRD
jgi:hypothetical protein